MVMEPPETLRRAAHRSRILPPRSSSASNVNARMRRYFWQGLPRVPISANTPRCSSRASAGARKGAAQYFHPRDLLGVRTRVGGCHLSPRRLVVLSSARFAACFTIFTVPCVSWGPVPALCTLRPPRSCNVPSTGARRFVSGNSLSSPPICFFVPLSSL